MWLQLFMKTIILRLCLHVPNSQPYVLLCDNIIFLPRRWKGQVPQSEHELKRIFQSYGKMSPFLKARPWTCKVTNSSRLQPITLIQLLVVKITNLSDVCVIRNNLLLADVENWRVVLDWMVSILLEVNNSFMVFISSGFKLFRGTSEISDFKTKWKLELEALLICWSTS